MEEFGSVKHPRACDISPREKELEIRLASEADLDALVRLAGAFRDHLGLATPAARPWGMCRSATAIRRGSPRWRRNSKTSSSFARRGGAGSDYGSWRSPSRVRPPKGVMPSASTRTSVMPVQWRSTSGLAFELNGCCGREADSSGSPRPCQPDDTAPSLAAFLGFQEAASPAVAAWPGCSTLTVKPYLKAEEGPRPYRRTGRQTPMAGEWGGMGGVPGGTLRQFLHLTRACKRPPIASAPASLRPLAAPEA